MMRTLQPEIARAVALVNLPERSAAAMVAALESFGENDVVLTMADLQALEAVCGALREVFAEHDVDRAATLLNGLLAAHAGAPRLVRHEGSVSRARPGANQRSSWGWHLHVDRADDAPWADWLASSAALALATRLVESGDVPWGVCAAHGCDDVFVHDGRGGERHWCSTTCATRERVRRHRALSRRRTRPARPARGGASATG